MRDRPSSLGTRSGESHAVRDPDACPVTALRESVAKAEVSCFEDATMHEMPAKKTAPKKAAKKAPARRTTAK